MKKFLIFFIICISQLATIEALDIEGRVACFYPQSKHVRDIYGKSGFAEYEIEVSGPLKKGLSCSNFCSNFDNWAWWVNGSYFNKKGHSTCLHNKTHVYLWTANVGLKRYFDFQCSCFSLRPYLGFGVGACHTKFNDHNSDLKNHNQWGFALLAKSGIEYEILCNLFLDLFLDYSYNDFSKPHTKRCVSGRSINMGGLKVGLGIGMRL